MSARPGSVRSGSSRRCCSVLRACPTGSSGVPAGPAVGDADVERRRHRVVAGVRGVVAGRAGAHDDRHLEIVVDAAHVPIGIGMVLKRAWPRATEARARLRSAAAQARPGVELGEHDRVERGAGCSCPRRRSRADRWRRKRTAGGTASPDHPRRRRNRACPPVVEDLGGEQPRLEFEDRIPRGLIDRAGRLGVALRGAVGLVVEIEVDRRRASIPSGTSRGRPTSPC